MVFLLLFYNYFLFVLLRIILLRIFDLSNRLQHYKYLKNKPCKQLQNYLRQLNRLKNTKIAYIINSPLWSEEGQYTWEISM